MEIPLRVLIIEDSEDDALLIVHQLERAGYKLTNERVETREAAMREALERQTWDIIISDYKMPRFSGIAALKLYKEKGLDIPFIIVSGTIGEEIAAEAMVSGAHDYVMKNNLPRLIPAIQRELREAESRRELKRAEEKLQDQFELITTLLDTIPSPIFYKDTSGVYQGCNRAWEEFFGMSKENIIGKTVYDVEPAEIADKYKAMDQELFDRPGMQTYEWKAKAADGSEKEIIFNKATFKDSSGCVAGLVGVMIDITGRKLAEEELKQTLEKLRKSLIGIIQALSSTVETRDPYTASHQRKVSNLARTIAQEMGLSDDTVDTIRMAGISMT